MKQPRRPISILLPLLLQCSRFAICGEDAASPKPKFEPQYNIPTIQLQPGFNVQLVAGADKINFPMCATFDERGRLFVTESSGKNVNGQAMAAKPECRVRMLEDFNGDGIFDKSTVFAENLSLPMGIQWYRGSLYVASAPDFVRLDDKDGDGVSDHREIILSGWKVLNTASLHGPFLGPDGWMYLTHGRHGYEIDTKEGEHLTGMAARIWRCRPDGTGLERVCGGGFDNPVELVFTPGAEMIGTMTYFTEPKNGQRDALMHWVEGGAYPKPYDVIAELKRTGDLMPVMTKFARIAPAGLLLYRGDVFGSEFAGNLFSAQFNPHRVQRHQLFRDGATFRTEDEDFMVSTDPDFHPTDLIEDADGSLLVLDTGGWYVDACPLSKISKPDYRGGIYRIRRITACCNDDPRGAKLELDKKSVRELADAMEDRRSAVRDRALDLLVERGEDSVGWLMHVQKSQTPEFRCAALWGLFRIGTPKSMALVRSALGDKDPQVRIAAAHALGMARDAKSMKRLASMAIKDEPPVRREAATALGRIGNPAASKPLLSAAADSSDRFIEHAIIYSLIELNDADSYRRALKSPKPPIRKAALIAMDQMGNEKLQSPLGAQASSLQSSTQPVAQPPSAVIRSPLSREDLTPFLHDPDEFLRKTALWVFSHHSEWSDDVIAYLRSRLTEKNLPESETSSLRDALLSFEENEKIQQLLADLLRDSSVPPTQRILILDALDRSSLKKFPTAWLEAVSACLADHDSNIRSRSVALIRARGITNYDLTLSNLADSDSESSSIRIAAIGAVLPRKPELEAPRFAFLTKQLAPESEVSLRLTSAQILGKSKLSDDQLLLLAREQMPKFDSLTLSPLLDAFSNTKNSEVGSSLVAALSQSSLRLDQLGGGRLEKLLQNFPSDVQTGAQPLYKRIESEQAARVARLSELEPLLSGGDVGRGRRNFFGKKAACSGCHAVGTEGGNLGPDLTTIGAIRSGRDLLEAVIFPSATFVPGYEPFRIETAHDIYSGVIGNQNSEAIVLRTGADAESRIPRNEIKSMTPSTVSVMPEALDTALTQEELLDLLAFLQAQNGEQWLQSSQRKSQLIPLFNGRDLTGFYTWLEDSGKDSDPDQVFSVQEGTLKIDGQHTGHLGTKSDTRNYRLSLEFKHSQSRNAEPGPRFFRLTIHATGEDQQFTGGIVIWVSGDDGFATINGIGGSSVTSNLTSPKETAKAKSGEWHALDVTCDDDNIKLVLDGVVIAEGKNADPKIGRILIGHGNADVFFRRIDLYPTR